MRNWLIHALGGYTEGDLLEDRLDRGMVFVERVMPWEADLTEWIKENREEMLRELKWKAIKGRVDVRVKPCDEGEVIRLSVWGD